jgi:hypothetical protein
VVISLLAVLDSAALILVLAPEQAPVVAARLCLRGGFSCLGRVARAMGLDVPEEADPEAGITLTYEEFLEAISRLEEVGFDISREASDAWPEFVGWRVGTAPPGRDRDGTGPPAERPPAAASAAGRRRNHRA